MPLEIQGQRSQTGLWDGAHISGALTFFGPQEGFTPGHHSRRFSLDPRAGTAQGSQTGEEGAAGVERAF